MFPLSTKAFPKDASELESLLNESIGRLFKNAAEAVTVADKKYPELASVRIALDRAELRANAPRPPVAQDQGSPALSVDELRISAASIVLGPATADLDLTARDVRLSQSRDGQNEIVLLLQSAAEGTVEISASKEDLERAIAALAKEEAGKQGVVIDQVQLLLRSRGTRSVDAEVQLRAKKLFFTTTVRIAGKLDLDDELNATLSGLSCDGEGAIGSLACGVLQPHLAKADGRSFSLMALPLGEIRLRDVRLMAGEKITVSAEFGS